MWAPPHSKQVQVPLHWEEIFESDFAGLDNQNLLCNCPWILPLETTAWGCQKDCLEEKGLHQDSFSWEMESLPSEIFWIYLSRSTPNKRYPWNRKPANYFLQGNSVDQFFNHRITHVNGQKNKTPNGVLFNIHHKTKMLSSVSPIFYQPGLWKPEYHQPWGSISFKIGDYSFYWGHAPLLTCELFLHWIELRKLFWRHKHTICVIPLRIHLF